MAKDRALLAKHKEKYKDEQVFVVPFACVSGIKDGFTKIDNETKTIWSKYDNVGKYIMRYDAECEPTYQQIIPHILIQNPENKKFYVGKRLKGEERLLHSYSLGFGGHLNPCDGTKDILFKGMVREYQEELFCEALSAAKFVGYVRDMKSSTNDHIGCVFVIEASEVSIKEKDNIEGCWMSIEELEDKYFSFENWAQYIINYLVVNKKF